MEIEIKVSASVARRTFEGVVLWLENYRAIGCSECGTRPINSNFRSLITGRPEGVQWQARMPVYRLANDILPAIKSWSSAENDRVNIAYHSIPRCSFFFPLYYYVYLIRLLLLYVHFYVIFYTYIYIYRIYSMKLKKIETFLYETPREERRLV